MSGHSHFSTIKRKKEITDKKRGQVFSKITRLISLAVKEGGGNIEANPKLKNAIEEGKKVNLPKALVEKAIQKGSGELSSDKLESFLIEAYGPENVAIIIEGITDNKNRSLSGIKKILNDNNGKMVTEGAIKWQFEQKGVIIIPLIKDLEDFELKIIELGIEDFQKQDNFLIIYTKTEDLEKIKKNIDREIEDSFISWIAKEKIEVSEKIKKNIENLFELLSDHDDVQQIYSNLK